MKLDEFKDAPEWLIKRLKKDITKKDLKIINKILKHWKYK